MIFAEENLIKPTMPNDEFLRILSEYFKTNGIESEIIKLKNISILKVTPPEKLGNMWLVFSLQPMTVFEKRAYGFVQINMMTGRRMHRYKKHFITMNEYNLKNSEGCFFMNKFDRIEGNFLIVVPPEGIKPDIILQGKNYLQDGWVKLSKMLGVDP